MLNELFRNDYENCLGLSPELKGKLVYEKFKKYNKTIFFITSSLFEANKYYQIIANYTSSVSLFVMDDFLTSEALATNPELMINRLETLTILQNQKQIVIVNLMGLLRFLPQPSQFYNSFIKIEKNNEYNMNALVDKLIKNGYERTSVVNKTGEIAVRGFVLDVFSVNEDYPIRLEFWGDEIDKISKFDIDSQLTIKQINSIIITPNTEFITDEYVEGAKQKDLYKYIKVSNILEYVNNKIIIYNDYDVLTNSYQLLQKEIKQYNQNNELSSKTIYMNNLDDVIIKQKDIYYLSEFHNVVTQGTKFDYKSKKIPNFTGSIEQINNKLNSYLGKKYVILCISSKLKIRKVINMLDNPNLILTTPSELFKKKINILNTKIQEGFEIDDYIVITEKELFNQKEETNRYHTNFKIGTVIKDINKLEIGDYIVHNTHGIGIYKGIKTLEKNKLKKDYLTLEYKDGDKVYIPVEKIENIKKYSSNQGRIPKISKLGGSEWKKTKARVKKKIESIAGDLLKLYSEREATKGFAFVKDDQEQIEFEKEFPFNETKDQLKVSEEIKRDMEKDIPMDRLLVGDVGYGKTEVAFRAIFKAMMSNKQSVILCPTTILSNQHYQSALERFKSVPVNIALLNRFVSKKEQTKILQDLSDGKIDLLIGTHRILSDDVIFNNLGLLVIDEEQRFGVKHKEKIKQYKNNVDVLTLSATPIPRTLQMSMAGIRNLSLIETPPANRYPIQTYVIQENDQLIKEAIYKELSRDGQVFILFNNVKDMDQIVHRINRLVPESNIISAHGQTNKTELENVMIDFINKKYNVLICTTIIETGIDIPSANTLIIYDADRFGLAQLYQIRGRVGRSNKIAYCYLMYNKSKILSDIAKKRLNVIKDFTELGSGFSIAMRDLSIRGAGDILGSEQAGFIDSVGVELFMNMLNEEVNKIKGKEVQKEDTKANPLIDVETTIADNYVSDEDLKIEIHQKINSIDSLDKLKQVKSELEDRFGKINESIEIYMYEQLLEYNFNKIGITDIRQTKNSISVIISKELLKNINTDDLFVNVTSLSRNFRFALKFNQLHITLDIVNLDKHFIYYLIDLSNILNNSLKTIDK